MHKHSMDIYSGEQFQIPTVKQGQRFFIEPTDFCGESNEHPCFVFPV